MAARKPPTSWWITGWIGLLARAIPQSVSAGLQLGLGLLMGVLGLKLILENPWLGFGTVAILFALTRIPRCPAAPIALGLAIIAGAATGNVASSPEVTIPPLTTIQMSRFELARGAV